MFKPTQEQILNNELFNKNVNLLIEAGAGTGKSTQLRYLAEVNPDKTFLVICFNSANALESNNHPDKPSNIYYSTVHSIAYREIIDKNMKKKLQGYLNYKDFDSEKLLQEGLLSSAKDKKQEREFSWQITRIVLDTITSYCNNTSNNILDFSKQIYKDIFTDGQIQATDDDITITKKVVSLTEQQQEKLAIITREHWLKIIDSGTPCYITHDVYLKLFFLRGYSISSVWDKVNKEMIYPNVLMLDEAQDSNAITLRLFEESPITQKVAVGDRMQQLYSWRGAVNAMDYFHSWSKGQLTQSFRFNKEIAEKANAILDYADSTLSLSGLSTKESISSESILCRTNIDILYTLLQYAQTNTKVYCNADLQEVFSKLYHINAVAFDKYPKYPNRMLKDITNKEQYEEGLCISADLQFLDKLRFAIINISGSLHKGICAINSVLVNQEETNITVSTIHKSKGLEYDKVIIDSNLIKFKYDKFGDIIDAESTITDWLDEKENLYLLYVALTRAKVKVVIPEYLQDLF